MSTKAMSRNARYEAKKRENGLTKCTLWIPEELISEFKQMAETCVEDRDVFPFMVRSKTTGRMRKGVD